MTLHLAIGMQDCTRFILGLEPGAFSMLDSQITFLVSLWGLLLSQLQRFGLFGFFYNECSTQVSIFYMGHVLYPDEARPQFKKQGFTACLDYLFLY